MIHPSWKEMVEKRIDRNKKHVTQLYVNRILCKLSLKVTKLHLSHVITHMTFYSHLIRLK